MPINDPPLISVLVPTCNRLSRLLNLLRGLEKQTLEARFFEVVVCDDGSREPVGKSLESVPWAFSLRCLVQSPAGPAAARNRALHGARGRLALILNDDAVPDPDLLRVHLESHARSSGGLAVLGSFGYVERSLRRPFVRLMEETDLMFDYAHMRPGHLYDWLYFWTCNISISMAALRAVDGFDPQFKDPMCEDIELGLRLQKIGLSVLYNPEARCLHDHDMDPDRFARRMLCLGRNLILLCEKHPEPEVLRTWGLRRLDGPTMLAARRKAREGREQAEQALACLEALDRRPLPEDKAERMRLLTEMETLARRLALQRTSAGMVEAWCERHGPLEDPRPVLRVVEAARNGPEMVSIIIPCIDGYEHTEPCLDSIAAHTPGPHEVIVVDNGSGRETLAALRSRQDIVLMEMGKNLGAPAARNRGMARARGEVLVFLDNDTRVTPGWLEGLKAHTQVNPRVGLVGPMSNSVSGPQYVDDPAYDPSRLDSYAVEFARCRRGQHHYVERLILFCLYVKREVAEKIGGFDPAFGRWGFEDDDYCLRATIAGFRLRVAGDVFIHHTGSRTAIAAGIDYGHLLRENWSVFKRKWKLNPDLPYGTPYPASRLTAMPFDPRLHAVSLNQPVPGVHP
ncbi:MAG: glycosyltransferase family 2 protein [Acidobacteriota bacterium]